MIRNFIAYWDTTGFRINRLVYYILIAAAVLFMLSYFVPFLFTIAQLALVCTALALLVDFILLYRVRNGIVAQRNIPQRFSNGDDNLVRIEIENHYDHKVKASVIDELPFQLQERNWKKEIEINSRTVFTLEYHIRPQERGAYDFGDINIYVEGPLRLSRRRFILTQEQTVKVYPSYIQMRRYQLIATGAHVQQSGVKRMRKLGHSMEFEQIKEYVRGDDYRTINWKATARHGDLMVNNFTDEKSQQIYCVINKGRVMKMPFEGMTLLDYAINTSLMLTSVALQKQDRAGLITFGQQVDAFITADKKPTQVSRVLEALYKQETNFLEPDFEKLFSVVRNRITQRSLLVMFTNFESMESMERELPSLKRLAHYHLLMVVFFENTELRTLVERKASSIEDIYIRTIAEKFRYEKQLIARELQKHGIISILTTPDKLSINSLNKYLELKNRMSI